MGRMALMGQIEARGPFEGFTLPQADPRRCHRGRPNDARCPLKRRRTRRLADVSPLGRATHISGASCQPSS